MSERNSVEMPIRIQSFILFLSSISISGIATFLAVQGNTSGAATCYVAGMLFLVFSNIDRFTSVKGLGFEANMRELGDKIKEADAVLKQLRSLSTFASRAVVDLTNRTGRIGVSINSKERYQYVTDVIEHLEQMGVSKDEIRRTLSAWVYYSTFDLMNYLMRGRPGEDGGILKSAEEYRRQLQAQFNENCQLTDPLQSARRQEIQTQLDKIDAWLRECRSISSDKSEFLPEKIELLMRNVYWLTPGERGDLIERSVPIIKEIKSIRDELKYRDLDAWARLEYRE
jgi:hypothetical protein